MTETIATPALVLEHPETTRQRKRKLAPNARVETMRERLALTRAEFSEALGMAKNSYGGMLSQKCVPETVALAAEALVRRQARDADDLILLLRVTRGITECTRLDKLQQMQLDGKSYWLVPGGRS